MIRLTYINGTDRIIDTREGKMYTTESSWAYQKTTTKDADLRVKESKLGVRMK